MFAKVNKCVCLKAVAQPHVPGKVMMRRNKRRIVISLFRINIIAACGLNTDSDIAISLQRQLERAIHNMRIVLRRTPTFLNPLAHNQRKLRKQLLIASKRKHFPAFALVCVAKCVGWPSQQVVYQRLGSFRRIFSNLITCCFHNRKKMRARGRRIQPNPVCYTPILVGIVCEDYADFALICVFVFQLRPIGRQSCHKLNPVRFWHKTNKRTLGPDITPTFFLKRDRPRQKTTINFRKHHMHGKVTRG